MLNGLEEGWEEKSRNGVQQDKMEVLSRLEGTRRWVGNKKGEDGKEIILKGGGRG